MKPKRHLSIAITCLVLFGIEVAASDSLEALAKNWYLNKYSPLWESSANVDFFEVRKHYIDGFFVHLPGGQMSLASNTIEYWSAASQNVPQWTSRKLLDFEVELIGANTVSVFARWENEGITSTYPLCDRYIANMAENGTWQITNYIVTSCE
jgi:hypothetical protein